MLMMVWTWRRIQRVVSCRGRQVVEWRELRVGLALGRRWIVAAFLFGDGCWVGKGRSGKGGESHHHCHHDESCRSGDKSCASHISISSIRVDSSRAIPGIRVMRDMRDIIIMMIHEIDR